MSDVNPPPMKLPQALLKDPETAAFFRALMFHLQQLWHRTGGGVDLIAQEGVASAINPGLLAGLARVNDDMDNQKFPIMPTPPDEEVQHIERLAASRLNSEAQDKLDDMEKLVWL